MVMYETSSDTVMTFADFLEYLRKINKLFKWNTLSKLEINWIKQTEVNKFFSMIEIFLQKESIAFSH